jgi:hypothetical protein
MEGPVVALRNRKSSRRNFSQRRQCCVQAVTRRDVDMVAAWSVDRAQIYRVRGAVCGRERTAELLGLVRRLVTEPEVPLTLERLGRAMGGARE